jgi:hypothetical protein
MATKDTSFGILTLATPNDYHKAIGLALSLRASNRGVPTAVACSNKIKSLLTPYFDYVIEEKPDIRGFEHKVHLDHYSPFNSTFFFDSDVLVFKPVKPYAESWGNPSYAAVGSYVTEGVNGWGFDRAAVLRKIKHSRLVVIDGAGHAFFRKPNCNEVFELARNITRNYKNYAGDARYADEDAMAITMTLLNLPPAPYGDFFSRYLSARRGTMEMDASRALCRFIWVSTGELFEPCMIHFAMNEAPVAYTRQLLHLFHAYNAPTGGLIALGMTDYWTTHIKWPLLAKLKSLKRML